MKTTAKVLTAGKLRGKCAKLGVPDENLRSLGRFEVIETLATIGVQLNGPRGGQREKEDTNVTVLVGAREPSTLSEWSPPLESSASQHAAPEGRGRSIQAPDDRSIGRCARSRGSRIPGACDLDRAPAKFRPRSKTGRRLGAAPGRPGDPRGPTGRAPRAARSRDLWSHCERPFHTSRRTLR